MPPITINILWAIATGICAALAIIPLARTIVARLEVRWDEDLEEHARARKHGNALPNYTFYDRFVIASVAIGIGFLVVSAYGVTAEGCAFAFYYLSVLLLAAINIKHFTLPDIVVFPTLWVGLLYHAYTGDSVEHIYGAVAGYLTLFAIARIYRLLLGREGIGDGDLKAISMTGAWFGLAALPTIFGGFIVGCLMWPLVMYLFGKKEQSILPTGPAHFAAALAVTISTKFF